MPKASVSKLSTTPRVQVAVETVTPQIAEGLLVRNKINRNIRPSAVAAYARDMAAAGWDINGSSIVIDANGNIVDGQHRLIASVEYEVSFKTLVVRGVQPEAQITIDSGMARTLSDRLVLSGKGYANPNIASAVVRRVLLWQNGVRVNTGGNYKPTPKECLEALADDPTIGIAVEAACQMRHGRMLPASIIGLTWWLFWQVDESDCAEFWERLISGANLDDGNPILLVRNQIIRRNAEAGRIPETVNLVYIIKAWNHWRAGRDLSPRYRFSVQANEKVPEPK